MTKTPNAETRAAMREADALLARRLMAEGEARLAMLGCPKLNLQVRGDNTSALAFYERLGYGKDDVVSLGKRLIPDA